MNPYTYILLPLLLLACDSASGELSLYCGADDARNLITDDAD